MRKTKEKNTYTKLIKIERTQKNNKNI